MQLRAYVFTTHSIFLFSLVHCTVEDGGFYMQYSDFGRRIREERKKLGMTQEKLAEDVNLSTAYIGQIERGERSPTLENVVAIANRLGVTVDYLLSDSVEPDGSLALNLWLQLMEGRTDYEQRMAVNVIKALFLSLDEKED